MNDEDLPKSKEFRRSSKSFFLPKDEKPFNDYMVDLQPLMKTLGRSAKEVIERLVENCIPRMKIFIRPYACTSLQEVMRLGEELALEKRRSLGRPPQNYCQR